MKPKSDKINYRRNFEISIIVSLILIIIAFFIFPKPDEKKDTVFYYGDMLITTVDIPHTDQKPAAPPPPTPIVPLQFVITDDLDFLPDVEIEENTLDAQTGSGEVQGPQSPKDQVLQYSSLPYKPRKSYAHVPKITGCEGEIKLALHIGKDGKVIEHKVLKNTTNSDECLKRVLDSMYKSRWMPVVIEGDRFEFWLEESVIF